MKTNTSQNGKKKAIKALIIFIVIVLASLVLGFFIGMLSGQVESFDFSAIKEFARNALIYVTPVLFFAVTIFIVVFTLITYFKSKKSFSNWNGEDEEIIENTEKLIDICVSVLTVGLIAMLALYGIFTYAMTNLMSEEVFMALIPLTIAFQIIFIGDMAFTIIMQRACVQLVKEINPEKRGEALDLNFQKEWEGSMDEAQKLMTFEAGYRAFKIMNYAFIVAWIISTIGIFYGLSLAPTIFVSLLWLVMTITYVVNGYKIEHKNKKR